MNQMKNQRREELMAHLDEHITFPASKKDIIDACNEMSDVPGNDKKWFTDKLPEGTYENAGEIKNALGM